MAERLTIADVLEDLRPYPGRDWLVLRIVLAVLLSAVLVMAFQIEGGWLSLYFCFVFAKPSTKQTLLTCFAVLVVALPIIPLSLVLLKYTAEPDWLRLLALGALLFGAFFLSNIMTEGDIVRNLAILFATVLTYPDIYPHAYIWEEATFWLVPMVAAGVLPLILVTLLIRPERVVPQDRAVSLPKYGLLPDRWSNPEHVTYALKCTFAAMATYLIYTALDFQEIQTAMMTCLILALPKTEQIIAKTWTRITGAAIGCVIALVATIWIIPQSNSLGWLLGVIAVGSALAAWVSLSSQRIFYAGRQMALAQFMLITHSFGPVTDLTVLRDRLLGILLGNIMMAVTFKYLWPQKESTAKTLQSALPLLAIGCFTLLLLGGCRSAEELAPDVPSRPWRSPVAAEYRLPQALAHPQAVAFDPQHEYTLFELADMALRNNPRTRVAWEAAREAAAGVGVVQSTWYPQLNLMVAAGYEHLSSPLPQNIFSQGYFHASVMVVRPEVQLDWLLWDFGRRGASETRAREMAVAQNFAFNQEHQQLLFSVCSAYYRLISIRSALAVTQAALRDAQLVQQATRASLEQGFATQAEYLQAQQMVAQYSFDLSALKGDLRKGQVSLSQSVGFSPDVELKVRDITEVTLPEGWDIKVNELVASALESRPDMQALVAQLRAAQAGVDEAQAQFLPQLILTGNVGPTYSEFSAEGSPWVSSHDVQYGVGIALRMPLFDGFANQQGELAARARQRQMEAAAQQARNRAVQEVWEAYIDFENAREQLVAAEALLAASQAAYDATLASFKQGFASVVALQTQQVSLTGARESYAQARTDAFLSLSLLQLVTGQLSLETVSPGTPLPDASQGASGAGQTSSI